jgi:hypothetical protein
MEQNIVAAASGIITELRRERNDRVTALAGELEDIIDIIIGDLQDCANHPQMETCYMCTYNGTEACDVQTGYCFRYGRKIIRTGN